MQITDTFYNHHQGQTNMQVIFYCEWQMADFPGHPV